MYRVIDTYAETERAHFLDATDLILELLQHLPGPYVGSRDQPCKLLDVVASATLPWNLSQVERISDSEVGEWRQPMLVNRIP
jgi:hypothetical protein